MFKENTLSLVLSGAAILTENHSHTHHRVGSPQLTFETRTDLKKKLIQ
jgi:hypothetical protein